MGGMDEGKKIGKKWMIHGLEISAIKNTIYGKVQKGNPHNNLTYPNKLEIRNDERKWICIF